MHIIRIELLVRNFLGMLQIDIKSYEHLAVDRWLFILIIALKTKILRAIFSRKA